MSETKKEMEGETGVGSDGELDLRSTSFMRNTMVSSTMVSGEASETDEEDEEDEEQRNEKEEDDSETESKTLKEGEQLESTEIHEFELETKEIKAKRQKIVYKFDSPFHRKLRERNLELRSDLVEGLTQLYRSAGTRLDSSTFHLSRAQTAAQDVSHNTKMMLEDLSAVSVLLENVLGTELLNSLKTNVKD